ncbi:ATP-binding protein [Umezawaea sp. Da 62-37]|uniref:ATP-binding protein n=1 Tax=Umezawaea sp. Da 62-37 TaxID=3075927 RepID=UPI0028F72BEA|nr:ATP-binding protein [Umezawaea sp. Da 62-37]WNV87119.1 ATP-binding protein [Umezawaea sp. Da 62-37]
MDAGPPDPAPRRGRSRVPLVSGSVEDAVARLVAEAERALSALAGPWEMCLDSRPLVRVVRRGISDHFAVVLDADLMVDLLLVVEELVTNAYRHTRSPQVVRVLHRADGLRVEVTDGDPALPVMRGPSEDRLGGRGVLLVSALSHRWGTIIGAGGGKTVWAVLGEAEDHRARRR